MIRGQLPLQTSLTKVTTGVPQLSVAVTSVMSGAGTSSIQLYVTATGQVIVGERLSRTMIVCVQVITLPQESSAWYDLMMIRGQFPLHESPTHVTVRIPQLSVAVTCDISGGGTSVTQATAISAGHVIWGAIVSLTVIICVQIDVLLQESVAW